MKPAIKITTAILVCVLSAGLASAQSPSIIQNTRNTMKGVSNSQTAASNQALGGDVSAAQGSGALPVTSHPAPPTGMTGAKGRGSARRGPVAVRRPAPPKAVVEAPVAEIKNHEAKKPEKAVGADLAQTATATSTSSDSEPEQSVVPDSKYAANGRRDPFISPVVSHAGGSGCSTGKKCLEIGSINLRGVVRSENGFIAVVSNGVNKAYFLRENDPVFNGYVMRITGDSIVFQETLQDRLGKSFTREVVKKITTPAV